MEPVQQSQTTAPAASSPGLFGTKIPATAAFLIAVLLFLLPFAEIKCNNTAIASNTGLGIALGSDWKEVASKNLLEMVSETIPQLMTKNFRNRILTYSQKLRLV